MLLLANTMGGSRLPRDGARGGRSKGGVGRWVVSGDVASDLPVFKQDKTRAENARNERSAGLGE